MNKKITAAEFYDSVERELSGMKPDPCLARHVIAAGRGETGMKRKLSAGLAFAIVLVLVLITAACAVTGLYRVVNWEGEVTGTKEPYPEMPPDDGQWTDFALQSMAADYPEDETVYLWTENENHTDIEHGLIKGAQKTFGSHDEFMREMEGKPNLTLPAWLPEGEVKEYQAETTMECRAFGKYDLLEEKQIGDIGIRRFRIDESDRVNTGYTVTLTLEDESMYNIKSELRGGLPEEALLLREGETAEKVTMNGMDEALLIRSREWPDWIGLIMRRKLDEPVRLKELPYCELPEEENDDRYYDAEYVSVWTLDKGGRNDLLKVFSGE